MSSDGYMDRRVTLRLLWLILVIFLCTLLTTSSIVLIINGSVFWGCVFLLSLLICISSTIVIMLLSIRKDKLMEKARCEHWKEPIDRIPLFYSRQEEIFLSQFASEGLGRNLWEENRRQAQYKALQNQINPHFLYNTLEAIRSEALVGGLVEVAEMSESLAKFFRYTISNMEDFVSIADEIRNVRDYIRIQQYRFGDRIRLELPILEDEEALKTEIPKLILQPIVENAIIHGLEEKVEGGRITISSEVFDDVIEISVKDDGVGIDSKTLISINKNLSLFSSEKEGRHGGIAIYNVNNRLHLLFGGDSGLAYYSIKGRGTTAVIRIPRRRT